jgi:chemotaxis protein MotA
VKGVAVIPLGAAVIVAAQMLEGSRLAALLQASSAVIVLGGTLAAVLITYRPADIVMALRGAWSAFSTDREDTDATAAVMMAFSIRGYRRGLPALEQDLDTIADPFMREGLALVVDGVTPEVLQETLAVERAAREAEEEAPARLFEAAAGYAPTMGILGAVLGLMRVMERLNSPGGLGPGIALAFVATVYGVGTANLILLPIAGRLRERAGARARQRELITQALLGIQARANPRLVAHKLRAFSTTLPRIDELAQRGAVRPLRSTERVA